jgi:hypothetical protein
MTGKGDGDEGKKKKEEKGLHWADMGTVREEVCSKVVN